MPTIKNNLYISTVKTFSRNLNNYFKESTKDFLVNFNTKYYEFRKFKRSRIEHRRAKKC